jgi:hypothetical protein
VLETHYVGEEVRFVALLPARLAEDFAEFLVEQPSRKGSRRKHSLQTK